MSAETIDDSLDRMVDSGCLWPLPAETCPSTPFHRKIISRWMMAASPSVLYELRQGRTALPTIRRFSRGRGL